MPWAKSEGSCITSQPAGYSGYSCTSGAAALNHTLHFILTGHFGGDIYKWWRWPAQKA